MPIANEPIFIQEIMAQFITEIDERNGNLSDELLGKLKNNTLLTRNKAFIHFIRDNIIPNLSDEELFNICCSTFKLSEGESLGWGAPIAGQQNCFGYSSGGRNYANTFGNPYIATTFLFAELIKRLGDDFDKNLSAPIRKLLWYAAMAIYPVGDAGGINVLWNDVSMLYDCDAGTKQAFNDTLLDFSRRLKQSNYCVVQKVPDDIEQEAASFSFKNPLHVKTDRIQKMQQALQDEIDYEALLLSVLKECAAFDEYLSSSPKFANKRDTLKHLVFECMADLDYKPDSQVSDLYKQLKTQVDAFNADTTEFSKVFRHSSIVNRLKPNKQRVKDFAEKFSKIENELANTDDPKIKKFARKILKILLIVLTLGTARKYDSLKIWRSPDKKHTRQLHHIITPRKK